MQGNGLDKMWNQTLKTMVVEYVEAKKDVWDDYLARFLHVCLQHQFSLHSPFEVMFGRKAIIPIELAYHKAGSELWDTYLTHCVVLFGNTIQFFETIVLSNLKNDRMEIIEKVIKNISIAQGKQKDTYETC